MIYTRTHTHTHTYTPTFVYESHKVANILLLLAKYVWTMIKLLARSIAMWARSSKKAEERGGDGGGGGGGGEEGDQQSSRSVYACLVANCFNRKPQFQSVSRSDPKRRS